MDFEMLSAEEFFGEFVESESPKRRAAAPESLLEEAKAGDAEAQFGLGLHYYDLENDVSARKWLSRAAAQGHAEAKELLDQLDAER